MKKYFIHVLNELENINNSTTDLPTTYTLGIIYFDKNKYDKAIPYLYNATKKYINAYIILIDYYSQKKYRDCDKIYELLIEAHNRYPDFPYLYFTDRYLDMIGILIKHSYIFVCTTEHPLKLYMLSYYMYYRKNNNHYSNLLLIRSMERNFIPAFYEFIRRILLKKIDDENLLKKCYLLLIKCKQHNMIDYYNLYEKLLQNKKIKKWFFQIIYDNLPISIRCCANIIINYL